MLRKRSDFRRDPMGRKYEIDSAGGGCALRHSAETRRPILAKCDTARRLDGLEPQRSIRSRPGKNHADRICAAVFRQRNQKCIDRPVNRLSGARSQRKRTTGNDHGRVGGNDVNLIWLYPNRSLHLANRQGCAFGQQFRQNDFRGADRDAAPAQRPFRYRQAGPSGAQ